MKTIVIKNKFNHVNALIAFILCYFMTFFSCCTSEKGKDGSTAFVLKNVVVIDAVNGLRSDQSVIIRGNRIIEAGPCKEIKEPSDATIVDCKGKYLIPGLWDAHVHLTNNMALIPVMFPLLIVNGITYVRDTAAELDKILPLLEEAEEASWSGGMAPRVFFTGPHIDGLQLIWSSSVSAVSVEQARFIIDCLIRTGVDQIKVYDLLKPEICLEVLSYARSKGYKVSAHVPLAMDVIEASNAGLSSMEHMINLEFSCSSDWDSLLKARQLMISQGTKKTGRELREDIYRAQRRHAFKTQDEERRKTVLKTLAENNTWQVPTLVITSMAEHRIFARDYYRRQFSYLPDSVRLEWEKTADEMLTRKPSEEALAHAYWAYEMIPRLVEAGIGIMAGTDMPLALLLPGYSLHEELELLVRSGLTPLQALESATLRPAQFFGLDNQQGCIAEGMLADLVLLDANPLEDIKNTRRIQAVIRDGHFRSRDKLDSILSQLAKL